jgi:hypothetical protein
MNRTTARAVVPPILAACVIALILESVPDTPPPNPAARVEQP